MAFIVSAVTAVEAAIAVTTIASVATAVATVGAAMTVVGTVTKSKELTKIGSVMALAGGVTSLVNGAIGMAGAAEGAAGAAGADAAGGAADMMGSAANDATADVLSNAAGAANAPTSFGAAPSGFGNMTAKGVTGGFDLTSPGFGVNTGLPAGALPTAPLAAPTDFAGAVAASTPTPGAVTLDDHVASLGVKPLNTPAGAVTNGSDSFLSKLGSQWDQLSPTTKAELLKAGFAIPGAIQSQKNNEAALAIQQQRVNQTSHGSEVPSFGIIQRAMKGGV